MSVEKAYSRRQLITVAEVASAFAAARDKDHVAHTGRIGFFDRVLNQRLVHHRQHLFGRGFGGGQKARA